MLNLLKDMMIYRDNSIKLNLQLITNGILIPKLSEEFNTFSVQGYLTLDVPSLIQVKSITLQLKGFLHNFIILNKLQQTHFLIENNLTLLNLPSYFNIGNYKFPFELALPRSLPSSFKSNSLALSYEVIAQVELEDRQLSLKIPVQVINSHQVPRQSLLLSQHSHCGSIPTFVNYNINFPRRYFKIGENVNFKVLVNLMNKATLNHIEVKILQKTRLINVFQQVSDDEKYHKVTLIDTKKLLKNRLLEQVEDFSISLAKPSQIGELLPTMETESFEITHTVEIHLNYHLNCQLPQVRFIQVPIALTMPASSSLKAELPTYEKSLINSTSVPTVEAPPPAYENTNSD